MNYYSATIEEGRYITGEVAGMVVEPGANIGYVASQPIAEVFRGENAFALGVMKTNPTAKVYNKWTLTRFDPNLERQAAESLLDPPVNAALLSQHQDSPATLLAAQAAGKFGIGYGADMSDLAPKAALTSPTTSIVGATTAPGHWCWTCCGGPSASVKDGMQNPVGCCWTANQVKTTEKGGPAAMTAASSSPAASAIC